MERFDIRPWIENELGKLADDPEIAQVLELNQLPRLGRILEKKRRSVSREDKAAIDRILTERRMFMVRFSAPTRFRFNGFGTSSGRSDQDPLNGGTSQAGALCPVDPYYFTQTACGRRCSGWRAICHWISLLKPHCQDHRSGFVHPIASARALVVTNFPNRVRLLVKIVEELDRCAAMKPKKSAPPTELKHAQGK
ncbi:MAG: hypothetical protein ACI97A_001593 [Planctomycetota bacterium]